MALIFRCLCFTGIFILASVPSFSGMAVHDGLDPDSVTMSFNDFNILRDKAKDPEKIRNALFSYEKAEIKGQSYLKKNDYIINFNAGMYVTTYGNRDILVPFLSSELNLESLTVSGRASTWVKSDGFYKVYIKGAGRYKVQAKFTVTLNSKIWPRNLYLPLVRIPVSTIKIYVPDENIEAVFDKGVVIDPPYQGKGDLITGFVPAVSGVNIKWLKRNTLKKKVPLKMNAISHSYVSLEEKGAYCESEINFRVLKGETNFFRIIVPESVDILNVVSTDSGKPVSQWFSEKTPEGMVINVFASYKQNTSFGVRISYEKTEVKSGYIFDMPHLKPQSVERFENLIAIGSGSSVEIGEGKGETIERRDVRFLPSEIQKIAKTNALFYYKALSDDFRLSFNVKSHENAKVLTMRIERVEIDSVITEEGTVMTKIKYQIKNNQEQYLKIKLPSKSKLLSAFLSGKEVQPAISGSSYLIPITKSAETAFPVEIAFLTKQDTFDSFGLYSVCLPLYEQPVGELLWRLYTPVNYQPVYFGGNIKREKYSFSTRLSWLLSELSDNPAGKAYAGGGGEFSQNYEYNTKGVRKRFSKFKSSELVDTDSFSNQIRVSIPVTGSRYSFSSYLVSNFSPEIRFFYINKSVQSCIAFIFSTFMFVFTSWTLLFFLERKSVHAFFVKTRPYLLITCIALFLLALLATLSFGINKPVSNGIFVAIFLFAIYQNRQVSKRFHETTQGITRYFPEAFLVLLLLVILPTAGFRFWKGTAFICLLSVLFHLAFPFLYTLAAKILSSFFNIFKREKSVKNTTAALLLILSVLSGSVLVSENAFAGRETIKDATVSLSYDTLDAMLKKIENKEKAEKIKLKEEYIFGNVTITGDISKKSAHMNLKVPVSILSDSYVTVPVFSSGISIVKATFRGKPLSLFQKNSKTCFETRQKGTRPDLLEIELIIPVKEKGGVHEFSLNTGLLSGGIVELGYGKDIKSIQLDGVVWQQRKGQKIKAALGRSNTLRGELATFKRENEAVADDSKRVKKIYSTTYTLLSFEDEVATFYSSVRYRILNDLVREFKISLPENVTVNEIIGDDLEEWTLLSTTNGLNTYLIKVLYPATGKYDLSIQYEKSLKNDNDFNVPELVIKDVARNEGFIGVEMLAQAEIVLTGIEKAKIIDIQELPNIIREDAYSPFVYALRYVESPYKISFGITKHKNFQMDAAICDRIEYIHVISPQGKMLSQVRMWIRNSQKQFMSFTMPAEGEILSTYLDGRSIKPSIGKKQEILLPLKRQSREPFILEVVYNGPAVSLGKVYSSSAIRHPSVDIATSIVSTTLFVPEDIHLKATPGVFDSASYRMNFIGWGQSETDFSGNQPDDFQANQAKVQSRAMYANAPIPQESQQIRINNKPQKKGGTLSLKIDLPKHGKSYSFNTLYVPENKELVLGFSTTHTALYRMLNGLVVIALLISGFFIMAIIKKSVKYVSVFLILNCILIYFINNPWPEIVSFIIIGLVGSLVYNKYRDFMIGKIKAWA